MNNNKINIEDLRTRKYLIERISQLKAIGEMSMAFPGEKLNYSLDNMLSMKRLFDLYRLPYNDIMKNIIKSVISKEVDLLIADASTITDIEIDDYVKAGLFIEVFDDFYNRGIFMEQYNRFIN